MGYLVKKTFLLVLKFKFKLFPELLKMCVCVENYKILQLEYIKKYKFLFHHILTVTIPCLFCIKMYLKGITKL